MEGVEYEYTTPSTIRETSVTLTPTPLQPAYGLSEAEEAIQEFRRQYPHLFPREEAIEVPEWQSPSPSSPFARDQYDWTPNQVEAVARARYENEQVRILTLLHNGQIGDEIFSPARATPRRLRGHQTPELPTPRAYSPSSTPQPEVVPDQMDFEMDSDTTPRAQNSQAFALAVRRGHYVPQTPIRSSTDLDAGWDEIDSDSTPRPRRNGNNGPSSWRNYGQDFRSNQNDAPPPLPVRFSIPGYGFYTAEEAIELAEALRNAREHVEEERELRSQERAWIRDRKGHFDFFKECEAECLRLSAELAKLDTSLREAEDEFEKKQPASYALYNQHVEKVELALKLHHDTGHMAAAIHWFVDVPERLRRISEEIIAALYLYDDYDFHKRRSYCFAAAIEFHGDADESKLTSDDGWFGWEVPQDNSGVSSGNGYIAFSIFEAPTNFDEGYERAVDFVQASLDIRRERVSGAQQSIELDEGSAADHAAILGFKKWAADALGFIHRRAHDMSSEISAEEQEDWLELEFDFKRSVNEILATDSEGRIAWRDVGGPEEVDEDVGDDPREDVEEAESNESLNVRDESVEVEEPEEDETDGESEEEDGSEEEEVEESPAQARRTRVVAKGQRD